MIAPYRQNPSGAKPRFGRDCFDFNSPACGCTRFYVSSSKRIWIRIRHVRLEPNRYRHLHSSPSPNLANQSAAILISETETTQSIKAKMNESSNDPRTTTNVPGLRRNHA